jgi:hypothetical protein
MSIVGLLSREGSRLFLLHILLFSNAGMERNRYFNKVISFCSTAWVYNS